jgi:hypothetical protein
VQTIKKTLKKVLSSSTADHKNIQGVLNKILFSYRTTPLSSGGLSPCDLMLKFKPRTLLSLIKPRSPPPCIHNPDYPDYRVGEEVLVRVKPKSEPVRGVIQKRVSQVMYKVDIGGETRLVHMNQIKSLPLPHVTSKHNNTLSFPSPGVPARSRVDSPTQAPCFPLETYNSSLPACLNLPVPALTPTTDPEKIHQDQPQDTTFSELCHSSRQTKAPVRLNL